MISKKALARAQERLDTVKGWTFDDERDRDLVYALEALLEAVDAVNLRLEAHFLGGAYDHPEMSRPELRER